jgi:hypothetical protein
MCIGLDEAVTDDIGATFGWQGNADNPASAGTKKPSGHA